MARKNNNLVASTPTTLPVGDRAFNAALDHGAVIGAHTHIIARASVTQLKRGAAVTTGYTTGFGKGFLAGWRSVR